MSTEQIIESVEKIKAIADDDEAAHAAEDRLRHAFIVAIARDKSVPISLRKQAKIVLSTSTIRFSRWCA